MSAARLAATSTRPAGTIKRHTRDALAARFGHGIVQADASPLTVAAAACAKLGDTPHTLSLAITALITMAGARTDVQMYTGDCPGCALLSTAAQQLGWGLHPARPCPDAGKTHSLAASLLGAHCAVVLFGGGHNDPGTLAVAAAAARARIPLTCWCGACGPVLQASPCGKHSPPAMKAAWQVQTWGARQPAA